MADKTYFVDKDKTQPLNVRWTVAYQDFSISDENGILVQIDNVDEIKRGKVFEAEGYGTFSIKMVRRFRVLSELEIAINGKPLFGSPSDPYIRIKQTRNVVAFIGVLSMLSSLIALLRTGHTTTVGMATIAIGITYILLAYLGYYQRMAAAFMILLAMVMLDFGLYIYLIAKFGNFSVVGLILSIISKVFLSAFLLNGIAASREIKAEERHGVFSEELLDA